MIKYFVFYSIVSKVWSHLIPLSPFWISFSPLLITFLTLSSIFSLHTSALLQFFRTSHLDNISSHMNITEYDLCISLLSLLSVIHDTHDLFNITIYFFCRVENNKQQNTYRSLLITDIWKLSSGKKIFY